MHAKIGDTIMIEFSSADASTAALVTLKDANDVTRTLKAYERLLIDDITADIAAGVTADMFADIDADGNVDAGELTLSFGPTVSTYTTTGEGFSFPIGVTPKVKASGAGSVKITGTGRIIFGQTRPDRPDWRESLVPGH